jgi:hypothetical protein
MYMLPRDLAKGFGCADGDAVPDAILPSDVQKRIYEKCKDETEAIKPPKAFVDELSNLPPYVIVLFSTSETFTYRSCRITTCLTTCSPI